MNIFSIYFEKIKKFLIDLEKDKQIKLPDNLNKLTIELPPKDLQGDISCNAALVLSKINNKKPKDIAILLKTNLIKKFPEFKNIFIAEPGFLNIEFNEDFWQKFLNDLLNLKEKYGSNSSKKNKYNVEFVSANPTGPLHVGHCRGSILGLNTFNNKINFKKFPYLESQISSISDDIAYNNHDIEDIA